MSVDSPTAPSASSAEKQRGGLTRFLFVHEIDEYPGTGKRTEWTELPPSAPPGP